MSYVDTYGMLRTLYSVTKFGRYNGDLALAREEIHEIMLTMVGCMATLGNDQGSMFRTDQNKEELPLLHEVLCRKLKGSTGDDLAIGDALGGPAVFDITLPNGMKKFADLGEDEIDRLPQIFTDKMIAYEFDPNQKTSVREQLASLQSEDQMQRTIGAILYERRMRNMSLMKKMMCKTRNPEYYHKDSKRILDTIKAKINLNQKGAAVPSSNAEILANMQGKLDVLLDEMKRSQDKDHDLHGKSKQEVATHNKISIIISGLLMV